MIRNLRDLGGIVTADGRKIKKGLYFRSAILNEITDEDIKWFADNNITKVIDLRTKIECDHKPDTRIPGTEYVNFYLQEENEGADGDKGAILQRLRDKIMATTSEKDRIDLVPDMTIIYRAMILDEYSRKRFAEMIRGLVNYTNGAVLFHCTSGKDRTGMTAATLCSILGVSREAIFDDYLISLAHAEWEAAKMRENFRKQGASDELADKLMQLFTIDSRYLEAFFDEIERQYGNIDNYIHEVIGLDDEAINRFKERVLE